MAYTFAEQQAKLSSLIGDSNTGTTDMFPLAIRKLEINRGEIAFAKDSLLLREKASGTVASAQLAIPSDWLDTYVLIVDNKVITRDREISIKDYERWYNYGGSVPIYYMSEESGTRYYKFLGSVNGLTYILYYYKKPTTALSSDSDTSLFPDEFREASAYYAAAELLQQIGQNEKSAAYRAVYANYVREAMKRAESMYVDKQYASPDTNMIGGFTNDVQGGGYDWGNY